ncbi:hypothetical protein ABZV34_14145 [Streptomyces sp. NPDC005195]|uniref:hypothetical protein n=1 Tax=Streptomyces sp. NPDC005195 TaxID=3154561 RepID=UPI0033AFA148
MTQSPPPSGPPVDNPYAGQNPYATQPADAQPGVPQPPAPQPGVPQQAFPPGAPQPGFPVAPVAPARGNFALGLAAALGAGLVSAVLYGLVIGLTKHEIGYAAVGVGFLVGIAAGRVGGRSQSLPVAGVVLSVAAIYLGQLIGEAMIIAKQVGVGFNEVFFDHLGFVQDSWKADADPLTFVFFAIAAYVAFQSTRRAGL